jgi:CheY-like chemotaxis protein
MVKTFNDSAPEILLSLRKMMSDFSKTTDEAGKVEQLLNLYRKVHGLTGSAGLAGLHNISLLSSALEVLLKELYDKPKNVNASTLRTVASSVDFIFELFQKAPRTNLLDRKPVEILVVDDEILSRRAVSYALEKAGLKAASVEDPQTALTQASEKQFDLIFLDVQMPGLDGFELCTKIRAVPLNKTTPVIFVTNLNDLKSRARSSLSGGNDFIAKPFMFIELSVKALTYVMRNRLAAGAAAPEAAHPKLAAA